MSAAPSSSARPQKRPRKKLGRSSLALIVLALLCAAALRLGSFGLAIADDVSAVMGEVQRPNDAACETDQDIAAVLIELQNRDAELSQREDALKDRLQALSVAEEQAALRIDALMAAEDQLASTMALSETAASDDLDRLTAVYESMKPKQAIPLFASMDPSFAAGFLSRMKPASAAQIMSGLDPQSAYAISVVLAGRNANAPTN